MKKLLLAMILMLSLAGNAKAEHRGRFSYDALRARNIAVAEYLQKHKWETEDFKHLIEPNTEVDAAILFLKRINATDRQFIRFFTTYGVPNDLREQTIHTLSFVIHSTVAAGNNARLGYRPLAIQQGDKFIPLRLVPASQTLWWIDIRDYNWTADAFEIVAQGEGYFVEPIVNQVNNQLLIQLTGTPNVVLRADWFIRHVTDSALQEDIGLDFTFYDTLLYANLDRPPRTIDEWRFIWTGIRDLNDSRLLGNEYGTVVTNSNIVANANRFLFYYNTQSGYLYEGYDVKFEQGKRSFLESLLEFGGEPPGEDDFDAGEAFATNPLYMQVYSLAASNGNLVNQADPAVVRHLTDITGDPRVRLAVSCIDCHAAGPLPAENTLRDLLSAGVRVHIQDEDEANTIERTFLYGGFESDIDSNQLLFAKALKKVNGLSPEQNGFNYLAVIKFYSDRVSLKKAAMECGVTVQTFKHKLSGRVTGRLALLIAKGIPIPREIWENPGRDGIPGAFQQAMFTLNGLDYAEQQDFNDFVLRTGTNRKPVVKTVINSNRNFVTARRNTNINVWRGGKLTFLGELKGGQNYKTNNAVEGQWIAIWFNNQWAWVRKDEIFFAVEKSRGRK